MRKKNGASVSASDILAIVRTRSDWATRANAVSNPERCASIVNGKMLDANGVTLRGYVRNDGLTTLETNEEYRVRKGIASAAKTARKSGSTPAPAKTVKTSAISPDFTDEQLANVVNMLRASGFSVIPTETAPAPAPAPSANPAPSVKPGMTNSATKNASLAAIDRKLDTLGETREYVESNVGYALTNATVDQLRGINRVLGERIAKNAKS
jgi:hypothetical protein